MIDEPDDVVVEKLFEGEWVVPPGALLREVLREQGLTQIELAERMGRSPKTINAIVRGTGPISAATAVSLGRALNMSPRFWANLESSYRVALALGRRPLTDAPRRGAREALDEIHRGEGVTGA